MKKSIIITAALAAALFATSASAGQKSRGPSPDALICKFIPQVCQSQPT